ncbi:MAG: glycoside hydrolase family 9 protein [Fidelibacterota bacterium]
MKKIRLLLVTLLLMTILFASDKDLKLTDTDYLYSPYVSVFAFHNTYPVGYQGGIEIIQHNNRVATNGNIHVVLKKKTQTDEIMYEPIPQINNPEVITNKKANNLVIPFEQKGQNLKYEMIVNPIDNGGFEIILNFDKKVDPSVVDEVYFDIAFFPEYYRGKSFITDKTAGMIRQLPTSSTEYEKDDDIIIGRGKSMIIAPELPEFKMHMESNCNDIQLIDERYHTSRSWFVVRTYADLSKTEKAIDLKFRPNIIDNWMKPPMIAYSQVGYLSSQTKKAILELDPRTKDLGTAELLQLLPSGETKVVLKKAVEKWGNYYRYLYGKFDFTEIKESGVYQIKYQDQVTAPFQIDPNLYKHNVWQPTLLTFLPVQMCHMRVRDGGRIWHDLCHMDDGLQAPNPQKFYDGYDQNEFTETKYKANEHIPGMATGGWHDAGDDDVNTGSSGKTTYHLALAWEAFRPEIDKTNVDFEKNYVELKKSDGKPDMLQQIEHGVNWLLAQYRANDHSFVGAISKDWETYLIEGQWGAMTDNLIYNPEMEPDEKDGKYSGKFDDRYIFTNKDSNREYQVMAYLSAAYRALKETQKEKAEECLAVAKRIWDYEESHEPVINPSVGTSRNPVEVRINAACELYLATKDNKYLDAIVKSKKDVLNNMGVTAWTVARVAGDIENRRFVKAFEKALKTYKKEMDQKLAATPFGVEQEFQVWGMGWNILWSTYKHYYLVKHYPDIFTTQPLEDMVHYQLGAHAASNISFVSGVGPHQPIPAFGMNRSDFSYTPGGIFSGVNIIKPDFPELKEDHPFMWQQSEYIVFAGSAWIFSVLAVEDLLLE